MIVYKNNKFEQYFIGNKVLFQFQQVHHERVSIAQEMMEGIIEEFSRKFNLPERVMHEEQAALADIADTAKKIGPGPVPADPLLRVHYFPSYSRRTLYCIIYT